MQQRKDFVALVARQGARSLFETANQALWRLYALLKLGGVESLREVSNHLVAREFGCPVASLIVYLIEFYS
jgi:hypothetical protein